MYTRLHIQAAATLPGQPIRAIASSRLPYPAKLDPSSVSPVHGIGEHTMALFNALITVFTHSL